VFDVRAEVEAAERRIRPYVRETYLERSTHLSEATGADVHLKLENLQHTGSFKLRGALNKVLSLDADELRAGVVAASTGNHGAAVAYALSLAGQSGLVFVPEGADPSKLDAIRRLGAEVRVSGKDPADAERAARRYAEDRGATYVSPYNDPRVIGGQGTVGLEVAAVLERIDTVFVSLGGGGLIAGVAGYLKSMQPGVRVIGCSPQNSNVMMQSVAAGRILDVSSLPTLSDGTAGGVEAGALTFELCRALVDDYIAVSEEEIAGALRDFVRSHHMLIEGAAAVALAALRRLRARVEGRRVVVIVCGANIAPETLKAIL
jgi:threonine dehydratase